MLQKHFYQFNHATIQARASKNVTISFAWSIILNLEHVRGFYVGIIFA